ncbi:hypothetical protein L0152_10985 [bacterium]|nr:hypothetical protein [bacterium]
MGQIVDTESAKEFMKEALSKISPVELSQICSDLQVKSGKFQTWLNAQSIEKLSANDLQKIFRNVFSTRRKAQKLLHEYQEEQLKEWMLNLLYGKEQLEQRFQSFCDHFDGLQENLRYDLAGELLHFTFPDQYWLWTRWMWDCKNGTGALPLVITEDYELDGSTFGETYISVGRAVAFVHQVGEAAGFQSISHTLFGTDVFLSCVYVVYVYTVLRMRMTQEFNKVMPGLPEFSRRLLGVYKMEDLQ